MWHGVLLTARSGLVTAVILGTAHGIGETSPVLLTPGVTAVVNVNPFAGPMISLPLQVFDFVRSPEPNMVALGFGAAAVLILLLAIDKWRAEGVGLLFGGREGARARGGEHSESMSLVAEAPRLERALSRATVAFPRAATSISIIQEATAASRRFDPRISGCHSHSSHQSRSSPDVTRRGDNHLNDESGECCG